MPTVSGGGMETSNHRPARTRETPSATGCGSADITRSGRVEEDLVTTGRDLETLVPSCRRRAMLHSKRHPRQPETSTP